MSYKGSAPRSRVCERVGQTRHWLRCELPRRHHPVFIDLDDTQRLKMYKDSVDAWESAVAAFSTSDTSAAAVRQRKEYEDKLRDAKAALQEYPKKHELRKVRLPDDGNSLPWDRAATMMPDLRQRLPESARSSVSLTTLCSAGYGDIFTPGLGD